MEHTYSQEDWWQVVQYPELKHWHPKCTCGETLLAKSEDFGNGITNYTLYCPKEKDETSRN